MSDRKSLEQDLKDSYYKNISCLILTSIKRLIAGDDYILKLDTSDYDINHHRFSFSNDIDFEILEDLCDNHEVSLICVLGRYYMCRDTVPSKENVINSLIREFRRDLHSALLSFVFILGFAYTVSYLIDTLFPIFLVLNSVTILVLLTFSLLYLLIPLRLRNLSLISDTKYLFSIKLF